MRRSIALWLLLPTTALAQPAVPTDEPTAEDAAPVEAEVHQLACGDFRGVSFHEELSPKRTGGEVYEDARVASWLGNAWHAVGPALRVSTDGVTEITVTSTDNWRPVPRRIVLDVEAESVDPQRSPLESGAMVTFHFTEEESEQVLEALTAVAARDTDPSVGPDVVVTVGGVPLAGTVVRPLLEQYGISVPVYDRTAFEVATYLRAVLRCEERAGP